MKTIRFGRIKTMKDKKVRRKTQSDNVVCSNFGHNYMLLGLRILPYNHRNMTVEYQRLLTQFYYQDLSTDILVTTTRYFEEYLTFLDNKLYMFKTRKVRKLDFYRKE